VWIGDVGGPAAPLTSFGEAFAGRLQPVETVRWVADDGVEIEGLLTYPAGYEEGTRYPLVVEVHGGPSWQWEDRVMLEWHDWAQMLASNGIAVLLPNPRGSTGRGAEFARLLQDDVGGGESQDLIAGAEAMVARGIADADRLGIGGWSWGGYLTAKTTTRTGMFKAAVNGAGVANNVSDHAQGDIPAANLLYFAGEPYHHPDAYWGRFSGALRRERDDPDADPPRRRGRPGSPGPGNGVAPGAEDARGAGRVRPLPARSAPDQGASPPDRLDAAGARLVSAVAGDLIAGSDRAETNRRFGALELSGAGVASRRPYAPSSVKGGPRGCVAEDAGYTMTAVAPRGAAPSAVPTRSLRVSIAVLALQLALALVFVASAAAKVLRSDEFVAALRLSHLPEPIAVLTAVAVPALEIGLAFWLVLAPPDRVPSAFVAAGALLIAFTVWMGWVEARRLRVRCGCFGAGGGEVGPRTIARNLGLLALALTGWGVASRVASPLSGLSVELLATMVAVALCVALLQALRMAWPQMVIDYESFQRRGATALEGE
jgi:dienelactone hydrolase/uncharacterized membrane protein YphA (DoxX/SURF4 family)